MFGSRRKKGAPLPVCRSLCLCCSFIAFVFIETLDACCKLGLSVMPTGIVCYPERRASMRDEPLHRGPISIWLKIKDLKLTMPLLTSNSPSTPRLQTPTLPLPLCPRSSAADRTARYQPPPLPPPSRRDRRHPPTSPRSRRSGRPAGQHLFPQPGRRPSSVTGQAQASSDGGAPGR